MVDVAALEMNITVNVDRSGVPKKASCFRREEKVGVPVSGFHRDSDGGNPRGANADPDSPWLQKVVQPLVPLDSKSVSELRSDVKRVRKPKRKKADDQDRADAFVKSHFTDQDRLDALEQYRLSRLAIETEQASKRILATPISIPTGGVGSNRPVRKDDCVAYDWTEQFPGCVYPGCNRHIHWHCWACDFVDMCRYCRYPESEDVKTLDHDLCGHGVLAKGYENWCVGCFAKVSAAYDRHPTSMDELFGELELSGVRRSNVEAVITSKDSRLRDAIAEHNQLLNDLKTDYNRGGKPYNHNLCRRQYDEHGVVIVGPFPDCPRIRCDGCYAKFPCGEDDCGFQQRFKEKDKACVRCSDGRTVGVRTCPQTLLQGPSMRFSSPPDSSGVSNTRGMFGRPVDGHVPLVPFGDHRDAVDWLAKVDCLADMYGCPQPGEAMGDDDDGSNTTAEYKAVGAPVRVEEKYVDSIYDERHKVGRKRRSRALHASGKHILRVAARSGRDEFIYKSPTFVPVDAMGRVAFISGCVPVTSLLTVSPVDFNRMMNAMRTQLRYEHSRRMSCVQYTCLSKEDIDELDRLRRNKRYTGAQCSNNYMQVVKGLVKQYQTANDPKTKDLIGCNTDEIVEKEAESEMRTKNYEQYGKHRKDVIAGENPFALSNPEDMTITDFELSPSEITFRACPPGLENPPCGEQWTAWNRHELRCYGNVAVARPRMWPTDKLYVTYLTHAFTALCNALYDNLYTMGIQMVSAASRRTRHRISLGGAGSDFFRSPFVSAPNILEGSVSRVSFVFAQGYVFQDKNGSDNSDDSTDTDEDDVDTDKKSDAGDSDKKTTDAASMFAKFAECSTFLIVRHCRLIDNGDDKYHTAPSRHVGHLLGDNLWAYVAYAVIYIALEKSGTVPSLRLFHRSIQRLVMQSNVLGFCNQKKLAQLVKRVRRTSAIAMESECRVADEVDSHGYTWCRSIAEMEYVHFPVHSRLFAQLRYVWEMIRAELAHLPIHRGVQGRLLDTLAMPGTDSTTCVFAWRLNLLFAYVADLAFGPPGQYKDRDYDVRCIRNRALHDMICGLTVYRQPTFLLALIELTLGYDASSQTNGRRSSSDLFSPVRLNAILGYSSERDIAEPMIQRLRLAGITPEVCGELFDNTRSVFEIANDVVREERMYCGTIDLRKARKRLADAYMEYEQIKPPVFRIDALMRKDALFRFPLDVD